MNEIADKALSWVRSKFEVGTIGTVLVAASTYVGNFYYKSYFDFYFIDSADITIPLADSIRTFAIILAISGLLIAMVASADSREHKTFATALVDNIPLFVLLLLVSGLAIYIYWSNVETLSAWLSGALKDANLRQKNEQLTVRVTGFLKWALLIGPPAFASVAVLAVSALGFSFSCFLLKLSLGKQLLTLCLFVLLVLSMASAWGTMSAFLEFTGMVGKPEVRIMLKDDKVFQDGQSLYVVARSDGDLYVVARPVRHDLKIRSWQVQASALKHIEFGPGPVNPTPFIDYLK